MTLFRSYERRVDTINKILNSYGTSSIEETRKLCDDSGIGVCNIIKEIQSICFENARWAYIAGVAIAIKKGGKNTYEVAKSPGEGLQSFCISRSVADDCKIGIGHGNLAAMLLSDETKRFAFLTEHESFTAAGGTIGTVCSANKTRKEPLRIILNGLGKDATKIVSRIDGFICVKTQSDYFTGELKKSSRMTYSQGGKAAVNCHGVDDVRKGVAVMYHGGVDVSITGNSTNPIRFQYPAAGTYKRECIEQGKKYFSITSGGGTERTLHLDNMAAGPASCGMTDTVGRMHSDVQFTGSSSVPAHVEMTGLIGMGNNPMVGVSVAVAVIVSEAMNK